MTQSSGSLFIAVFCVLLCSPIRHDGASRDCSLLITQSSLIRCRAATISLLFHQWSSSGPDMLTNATLSVLLKRLVGFTPSVGLMAAVLTC